MVLDNATGAGHRVAWDRITVVDVFQRFIEHYRIEVRFCNPASGWEKGSVENAVGFLRRNVMVPLLNAESYAQLTRFMLSRCDEIAERPHYRLKTPVGDPFADERACMQRLPSHPFDACRWEIRKADKQGVVEIDSHRYLAGPSWHGWTLDVGLRAFDAGDPHPGRALGRPSSPRLREGSRDGQEPGLAAARAGQEDPRVGREPDPW